jgi:hypothetical protein
VVREPRPLSRKTRRTAAIAGVLLLAVAVGWVITLPMRQTRFQVVDHRLETADSGVEVQGVLKNRGAEARNVLVEAYLYDDQNRWLGTAQATLSRAPGDSTAPFAIPVDPRLAPAVERYSLYAGVEPNPFAPGM